MADQNIAKLPSLLANNAKYPGLTDGDLTILTCPSGATVKINSLYVTNNNLCAQSSAITCKVFNLEDSIYIAKDIVVPYQTSIILIDKDTPVYLQEYDSISLSSSLDLALDAMINYDLMNE